MGRCKLIGWRARVGLIYEVPNSILMEVGLGCYKDVKESHGVCKSGT